MFGNIEEVIWVSKISLSVERENNIRDCFIEQKVDFNYPNNKDDFDGFC